MTEGELARREKYHNFIKSKLIRPSIDVPLPLYSSRKQFITSVFKLKKIYKKKKDQIDVFNQLF